MSRKDSTVIQMYIHETGRKLTELGVGDRIGTKCVKSTLFSSVLPPPPQRGTKPHVEKNSHFDISSWSENKSCWLSWLLGPSGLWVCLNFLFVALAGYLTLCAMKLMWHLQGPWNLGMLGHCHGLTICWWAPSRKWTRDTLAAWS